jgi:hypothetical protein
MSLRLGVATPAGSAAAGLPMTDLFADQLVLGVELGVRATPHLFFGVFGEGGFGDAGDAYGGCGGPCGTSASSGRLGLVARLHFAPTSSIDPWIAYGVAIAGAQVTGSTVNGDFTRTFSGVEYAKLSVGADVRLSGYAALGLFAEWTSGRFNHMEDRENGVVVASGRLADKANHSWFTIGPRLVF